MDVDRFKAALAHVYRSGELDSICSCEIFPVSECSRARKDKNMLARLERSFGELENVPFPVLIYGLRSVEVMKAVVLFMFTEGGAS